MTDREEKLNKIRSKQAALTIVTDGEPLIESLQSKINELKKALETDIEVNVDDLINELKRIESIAPTIKSLVEAIDAIEIPPIPEIPDSIEVRGLTYVVETLDKQISYLKQIADFKMPDVNIKVETISKQNTEMINKKLDEVVKSSRIDITNLLDKQSIIEVTRRLDDLIQAVSKNVTSQNAEDYMPTRRVVKIGNKLLFDDSVTGGGGGGGGIPRDLTRVNETAIAVVNPDGTNIGGGSGGAITNDGTFATPARQDTGNTSLATVVTNTGKIPSQGQALAAASLPVVLTAAQITTLTPPAAITNYANETGGNLAAIKTDADTIAGAVASSIVQENVKQINGITPLMGNGTTDTGSQRVTISNDSTGHVELWDATSTANILAPSNPTSAQSGQNSLFSAPTGATTTTITLNAGSPNGSWYDVLNYSFISAEVLTNTATTITWQTSGDSSQTVINSMGFNLAGNTINSNSNTVGSGVTGNYYAPRVGRYFRVSSNASGGNSATVVLTFYTLAPFPTTTGVQAGQSGTWTVQPGNTANTTAWLMAGGKTNNNAAPGATNIGALIGVANAAVQTWTEGNQVGQSMDLAGNTRIMSVATTSTLTNVASSASSVSLLASNNAAKSRIIFNESTQVLYLKFGTTASATSYTTQVAANTLFEFPVPTYIGAVDGIWASANGTARITEVV